MRDVEEFTVSPRQAEVRAVADTKKRSQDTSAVRRLVDAGALEDGTRLRLRPRTEVNADVRSAMEAWLAEDEKHGLVTWQNKASSPLVWAADGAEYSPSGLVKHIIALTSGIDRSVQGTKWWVDDDGNDLVTLSVSGKRQLYLAFWSRFLDRLHVEHPDWSSAQIPQSESWFMMPSPVRETQLGVSSAQGGRMRSELYLNNPDGNRNLIAFQALRARRSEVEAVYGGALNWEELPKAKACRVADYTAGDVSNVEQHDAYIDWMFDSSSRLRRAVAG